MILTGGTSINLLYKETGWEKLKDRREDPDLHIFYKMSNNITPSYLNNILPERFRNIHEYTTGNANDFQPIAARTASYSNYFLSSTVKSWNSQTTDLQNSPSFLAFKINFKSNREVRLVFYHCGSRSGQIYHARIRMNCSRLNKHLYDRNLIQSPKCVCGTLKQ
ncbi:unnamed protein product [Mytilus edulis]|uniref:Uncharacterized protein n=1 Tax=Mytilus edulis TaxID=6550 RepID=A0A8S3TBL4_MYTED|nr:unnamed protein product [Mytilus edulis]